MYHRGGLVVRAVALLVGDRGFDPWPRQTKIFKTGRSGFPLGAQDYGNSTTTVCKCQDNGLLKHWSKIVQEKWIYELSQLNNKNTIDTA